MSRGVKRKDLLQVEQVLDTQCCLPSPTAWLKACRKNFRFAGDEGSNAYTGTRKRKFHR